tara:strand:+ start:196 stop:567 length:372 start_codon:yes stop_codon:yes gene_type:complete
VISLARIRYTLGFARLYGIEFPPNIWKEVGDTFVRKVRNAEGWEIENETLVESAEEVLEEPVVEETEELVEEAVEESSEESEGEEESVDLSLLTKKELQALCDEKGLEYKKLDNKAKLLELLQ